MEKIENPAEKLFEEIMADFSQNEWKISVHKYKKLRESKVA